MSLPVIVIGCRGHAKVILDTLRGLSFEVLGYLAPVESQGECGGIEYLGNDEEISNYLPENVLLVNGLGSVAAPDKRVEVFTRFKQMGYTFATVVHPSVVIAPDVALGEGCQVLAGCVIQPGVCCAENVIINTRTGVDHDCSIAAHSHIAVGVTLSGDVSVGSRTHVGAGSTVIQGVSIGDDCVIAAGAVVIKNVMNGVTVAGIPARRIGK